MLIAGKKFAPSASFHLRSFRLAARASSAQIAPMRRLLVLCAAVVASGCQLPPEVLARRVGPGPVEAVAPSDAGAFAGHLPELVQPIAVTTAVGGGQNCLAGDTDGAGTLLTGIYDDNQTPSPDARLSFLMPDGGVSGCGAVYAVALQNGFFCYAHSDEWAGSYQAWINGTFTGAIGIWGQLDDAAADSNCLRISEHVEEKGTWVSRLRCLRTDQTLATIWSVPEPESASRLVLDADGCSLLYGYESISTPPFTIDLGSWVDGSGRTSASYDNVSAPVGENGGWIAPVVGLVGGAAIRTTWLDGGAAWTGWLPHGSTVIEPAPAWLTARPNTDVVVIEDGKAYAILPWPNGDAASRTRTISIVDTRGAEIGDLALDVPAESANGRFTVGRDGSLIIGGAASSAVAGVRQCRWIFWRELLR